MFEIIIRILIKTINACLSEYFETCQTFKSVLKTTKLIQFSRKYLNLIDSQMFNLRIYVNVHYNNKIF